MIRVRMIPLLLLLIVTSNLQAGCPAFWPSVVTSSAVHVADALSSRGGMELNPILGRGPFGWKQAGKKLGAVGGLVVAQALVVRANQRMCKPLVVFNITMAAGTGVVVGMNLRLRRK